MQKLDKIPNLKPAFANTVPLLLQMPAQFLMARLHLVLTNSDVAAQRGLQPLAKSLQPHQIPSIHLNLPLRL